MAKYSQKTYKTQKPSLAEQLEAKAELKIEEKEYKVRVVANALNCRQEAGMDKAILKILSHDAIFTVIEEKDGWGKLKEENGWVDLQFTSKV